MTYRPRSGIMLCYPFSEKRLLKWKPPWIAQPKLNGERCRVLVHEGRCLLLSSTEEIIASVPHIGQACLEQLSDGEYDGELYVHGWTWAEIHGVVSRTTNIHPRSDQMQLHLFDLVDESDPQVNRTIRLGRIQLSNPLHIVPHTVVFTFQELMEYYDRCIKEGYEGFVVRHFDPYYIRRRSLYMMKFKPKKTDHYKIIGVEQAHTESGFPKGMVGAFICIDDMGTQFKVGAGKLTHTQRKVYWQMQLDDIFSIATKMLKVEYQTLSDKNKVPHFSRAVEVML